MNIVYKPADGEARVFEVEWDDLDLEEFELIEQYSGKSYEDIQASIQRGRGIFGLLRPLLYIYLRREKPDINYRDVKPKIREIEFQPSLDEMLALQQQVEADPKFPNRQALLAELADDIAEARARGESGKGEESPTPPTSNRASRRAGKKAASTST